MISPLLVHMTAIAYFQQRFVKTGAFPLDFHRDISFSINGQYSQRKNSQREHSPTCVLCLGRTRVLCFRLCKIRKDTNGVKSVAYGSFTQEFVLDHGYLFILHPIDERTIIRNELDPFNPKFF